MNENVAAPQSCGAELISDPQGPANYPLAASSLPLMLHLANASLVGWDQTGSSSYTRLDKQNRKTTQPYLYTHINPNISNKVQTQRNLQMYSM